MRGTCVFVKKGLRVSGIIKERCDFGEFIRFVLDASV